MARESNIHTITLRLDLDNARDTAVWEYLHHTGKTEYKTCNAAALAIIYEYINNKDMLNSICNSVTDSINAAIRKEFARIFDPDAVSERPVSKAISAHNVQTSQASASPGIIEKDDDRRLYDILNSSGIFDG